MCGLAGFIDRAGIATAEELRGIVRRMTDTIAHRGPDDDGAWIDTPAGVALGHRRLSILDLSPEGHQPMHSSGGDFVIVFNGEIYNFKDIRADLEQRGHRFRGHSDTEIMLAAFEEWGVQSAVERFNGMFAFAVWNRRTRTLTLARDRLGKKPLYYGWAGKTFLFASELKALHAHPAFEGRIDRDVLPLYIRSGYIPAPYSIYKGIFKLYPGGILDIGPSNAGTNSEPARYWSVLDAARTARSQMIASEEEALAELEALVRDAVSIRMVADVPVGAFLSGGIDSSVVVATMQAVASSSRVKTFSIGFHEGGQNEAEYAKAVARRLGTDHTELYVTPEETRGVIPSLPSMFDEPFADPSQIPTFLVSQLARRSVTVALSGDGGDELFGGYDAYADGTAYFARNRRWPAALRRIAAACMTAVPEPVVQRMLAAGGITDGDLRVRRAAAILRQNETGSTYRAVISLWDSPESLVPGASELATPFLDARYTEIAGDHTPAMMLLDSALYLPDDILVKVDRASMAVSLESRCPLLDYRLFEFAWRVPMSLKRRNGTGKWLLKQLAYKLVSRELLDRPKTGFGVPIGAWLRGPLREWANDLLDPSLLKRQGWIEPGPVTQAWDAHLTGRADTRLQLWIVLMFQAWLQATQSGSARVAADPLGTLSTQ